MLHHTMYIILGVSKINRGHISPFVCLLYIQAGIHTGFFCRGDKTKINNNIASFEDFVIALINFAGAGMSYYTHN